MKILQKLFILIKNKYILATVIVIVWISFFDVNNVLYQLEMKEKLKEVQNNVKYYEDEINKNHEEIENLSINDDTITDPEKLKKLEKFAREKYLMKKDNEDIFVIVEE